VIDAPTGIVAGLGRAGTTWLHRQLEAEPTVFTPAQKDIWYFDRFYDRGLEWYLAHFEAASGFCATVDVSHDYFFHPLVPERIANDLPGVKVLIVLREPVSWTLSVSRREAVTRHGRGATTRLAYDSNPGTAACGLYSAYVAHWQRKMKGDVTFLLYDDFAASPEQFWADAAKGLGFSPTIVPNVSVVNDTQVPRVQGAHKVVAGVGRRLRNRGFGAAVGRVKRNAMMQRLLVTGEAFDGGALKDAELATLKDFYRPDVHKLSELLGQDLVARWRY